VAWVSGRGDVTPVEHRPRQRLRLLASDEIGRLAVVAGNTAIVLPVNYALDGDAVVFRTDPGTKLDQGPMARASFEVDAFDRERRARPRGRPIRRRGIVKHRRTVEA
jgi:nitroimidazol reductase NimA-like FMN-containing flavoprotein (pyridoxamine 5'-phosphate oxidase superfamily)